MSCGEERDVSQNWRLGGTLAFPIDLNNSLKLYASSGCRHARATAQQSSVGGIAWQYRWGGKFLNSGRCTLIAAINFDLSGTTRIAT